MAIVIVGAVNFSLVPNSTGPGDWKAVANLGSPLADLMRETVNKTIFGNPALVISGLVVLALLFAIYSPLGTFGTDLTGGARIFYGYSKEGSLPPILGKTNKKGAPTYAIIAASVLAVIFVIPYPSWYTLVDFVVVAGAVNFAIVNASLPILRKLYPKVARPFRVPAARLWSVIAFIASSLLIYWATYPVTIYALGVTLGGSLVFLYQVFTSKGQKIGLKHSIWIPFYIIGLIILSYLGGSQTGGTNLIPFPDDLYVVMVYAVIFWIISQVSGPRQPLRDLNEMIANAPVDPDIAAKQ